MEREKELVLMVSREGNPKLLASNDLLNEDDPVQLC